VYRLVVRSGFRFRLARTRTRNGIRNPTRKHPECGILARSGPERVPLKMPEPGPEFRPYRPNRHDFCHDVLLHLCCCPACFIQFWVGVLTHHCHQVKTAYGVLQGSYSYEDDSLIYGPGQGSRGGPGACVLSTSVLLQGQDRLARGITFCDPSQSHTYTNKAAMFIDNNTSATSQPFPGLAQDSSNPDGARYQSTT
jgi:hypothetical protein